jgi:hypothetical protein
VQVVPAIHVPDPVQVNPAHCPQCGITTELPVDEDAELVVVLVTGGAVPPRSTITAEYAGFVVKSAFQRQASPSPEKVDGIHEYKSV